MLGDQNLKEKTSAVPDAAIAPSVPLPEGITGRGKGRVIRLAERIFSLKVPGNHQAMAAPARGRGGDGGGGGGKERYGSAFDEENSCKQPLLVKVRLSILFVLAKDHETIVCLLLVSEESGDCFPIFPLFHFSAGKGARVARAVQGTKCLARPVRDDAAWTLIS